MQAYLRRLVAFWCVGRDTRLPGTGPVSVVTEVTPAALALWSTVILLQKGVRSFPIKRLQSSNGVCVKSLGRAAAGYSLTIISRIRGRRGAAFRASGKQGLRRARFEDLNAPDSLPITAKVSLSGFGAFVSLVSIPRAIKPPPEHCGLPI